MKKYLVWFLIFLSFVAILLRFSDKISEVVLGVKPISGISILSTPSEATVFIDEQEAGKTPYEDKNLSVREYLVRIEKGDAKWQGKVRLSPGTVTVINRDLASDSASSAGEMLTLSKGKGLTVIANQPDASVEIDGKPYGQTPLTVDLAEGEHNILVSHPNFLKRSIKPTLPKNFNLTLSVDLALSEADLGAITTTPVTASVTELVVKETPTGFLRVREKPSTAAKEVARVKPGDTLVLLEENGSWSKVRLMDNSEGYVSSQYVEKNPKL